MSISSKTRMNFYQKWINTFGKLNCYYCKKDTLPHLNYVPGFHHNKTTLDHFIPLSRGGTSKQENLVIACEECNNRKKDNIIITEKPKFK